MKTSDLFKLKNWEKGDRYQNLKNIYEIKGDFLFLPLFTKEIVNQRKAIFSKKRSKIGIFDLFKPEEGIWGLGYECSKFFLILNKKLYLLDNKSVHLSSEIIKDPFKPNGEHPYSKEEIMDFNRSRMYADAKVNLEKTKYEDIKIKKMFYSYGNENWYNIKDKFLQQGLYWNEFKTFFLITYLKISIWNEKQKFKPSLGFPK